MINQDRLTGKKIPIVDDGPDILDIIGVNDYKLLANTGVNGIFGRDER